MRDRIRVCYIIRQLGKGGAEKQLFYLVRGLDKSRFHPVVVSLTPGGYWKGRFKDLNVEIFEIEGGRFRYFKRLINILKFLRTLMPDIVHTFMLTANSYGRFGALLAGVPVIVGSERSIAEIGNDKKKWEIWLDKVLCSFTDTIICNTETARLNLIKQHSFASEKLTTILNGFDWAEFQSHGDPAMNERGVPSEKAVGTVGTLSGVKNHRLFLDVARIVSDQYSGDSLFFIIVGDGPLRGELQAYAQHIGLGSKVLFTGERDDIPRLLRRMDVFVHTSRYEGLCNAIMEAMAGGLPVVATDAGGNRELVLENETGFLCPVRDPSALAEKILLLLRDGSLARKMGAKGAARIYEGYSVEKMVQQTAAVYERLLKRKRLYYGQ